MALPSTISVYRVGRILIVEVDRTCQYFVGSGLEAGSCDGDAILSFYVSKR